MPLVPPGRLESGRFLRGTCLVVGVDRAVIGMEGEEWRERILDGGGKRHAAMITARNLGEEWSGRKGVGGSRAVGECGGDSRNDFHAAGALQHCL